MGAMNTVYKKQNFKIYDTGKEYIIHNSKLKFESHHTHIKDFKTCKYIINLCIHKTVPYHLSDYLLISILRLSDDVVYCEKIKDLLNKNRKRRYRKNEN